MIEAPPQEAADAFATADAVRRGLASSLVLCRSALDRAAAAPGIFWELDADRALAAAAAVDERVARGDESGLLAGVPVAVKDNFDVAGVPASLGIGGRHRVAEGDAVVVERLRAAGALIIGKTSMDTLAWSMSGQAAGFPTCENPAAPGCLPGGSSGGSAAAVAAGIVPLALGSDTAGSTRLPAAWCGVVGFKPTFGAVPLAGCAPVAPSLDSVGILSRSVRDCRLALEVLADRPVQGAVRPGLRIGVPSGWGELGARLREAGHSLVELAETWRAPGLGTILAVEFATEWQDDLRLDLDKLDESIRHGIATGAAVAAGEYLRARAACDAEERRARAVFDDVDVLVLPTCDLTAPRFGDPVPVAAASKHTRAFSAYGWPAMSLPYGVVGGKPVGLQLVAPPACDAWLLQCAEAIA